MLLLAANGSVEVLGPAGALFNDVLANLNFKSARLG